MKPRASLPRVFGKMRADTAPFVVGQIRGISLAVHGAKRRPPSRSPSTFQTVSRRGILGSLHAVWCIEYGASKPQGSLLSESTPGDRHLHVVVPSRYARSWMLNCHTTAVLEENGPPG